MLFYSYNTLENIDAEFNCFFSRFFVSLFVSFSVSFFCLTFPSCFQVLLISLFTLLSWKVPAVHVSFDDFIIFHVHIKKQINELHIPINFFYILNFELYFLCSITMKGWKFEINMEIITCMWYFISSIAPLQTKD